MIFLDASAIVAMLTEEEDGDLLADRLATDPRRITSPIAVFEAAMAISRIQKIGFSAARAALSRFLITSTVEVVDVTEKDGGDAIIAAERFGKGRHPAKLNMGDCFAYASAKNAGAKLLFKGEDFGQTDIEAA